MTSRAPLLHTTVEDFLSQTSLYSLTEANSFPIQGVFPTLFKENIERYGRFLKSEHIDHHIFYAHKASKQHCFLETAYAESTNVDVSSTQELLDALTTGFTPDRILANGPKDRTFLAACLDHQVLIAVNSLHELQIISEHTSQTSAPRPRILLRMRPPGNTAHSRFGVLRERIQTQRPTLQKLFARIELVWLSFHLDTIDLHAKQRMIHHLIDVRERLSKQWITTQVINIGWWFRTRYTKDYLAEAQHVKEYAQQSWLYGIQFLEEILFTDIGDGLLFKEYLLESFTQLRIEPGRSLLDQCWISIHNVIEVDDESITIDGNMYSLWSIAQEMPHDPLFFKSTSQGNQVLSEKAVPKTVFWNLCLESDRIYSRKIPVPATLSPGDYVAFINTAGYFSEFSDSAPIKHTERRTIILP